MYNASSVLNDRPITRMTVWLMIIGQVRWPFILKYVGFFQSKNIFYYNYKYMWLQYFYFKTPG